MLDIFRNQTKNPFIWVILGIIILAFVLTFNTSGPITGGPGARNAELTKIYDVSIDSQYLGIAMQFSADPPPAGVSGYEALQAKTRYEKSRLLFSGVASDLIGLTPFDGEVPQIKSEKVMTELIESVLVERQAAALGMGVNSAELNARVMRLERIFGTQFKDDQGKFDARKYDIFVRYTLGTSKSKLEAVLRREILRDKMAQIVTSGVQVSEAELDGFDLAENSRPRLKHITIDAATARAAVQVQEAEVSAWAQGHDMEIKAAYEAAGDKYNKPAKWSLRGILLKADPRDAAETDPDKKKANDQQWNDKKTQADTVRADLDKVWSGEQAIAAPKGGDDAGEASAEKKITEVAKAERSKWLQAHFTRVAAEKTEHDLTKDVGGQFIDDKSEDALRLAPFGEAVAKAVSAADPGTLVGPVEGSHGWWILMYDAKTEAVTTPIDTVKLELAGTLLREERAEKELDAIAQGVLKLAQQMKDKPLEDIAKAWNKKHTDSEDGPLVVGTAGPIGTSPEAALSGGLQALLGLPPKANDPADVPGLGKAPKVAAAAWKLTSDAPLAQEVFKSGDGKQRFIIHFDAPKKPTEKEQIAAEKKSREQLKQSLLSVRRTAAWRDHVQALVDLANGDSSISQTDAWRAMLDSARQRYTQAAKRAAEKKLPAAGAGSPLSFNLGGKPIEVPAPATPEPSATPPSPAPSESPEGAPSPAAPEEPAG